MRNNTFHSRKPVRYELDFFLFIYLDSIDNWDLNVFQSSLEQVGISA
jgi:hypothetical protein